MRKRDSSAARLHERRTLGRDEGKEIGRQADRFPWDCVRKPGSDGCAQYVVGINPDSLATHVGSEPFLRAATTNRLDVAVVGCDENGKPLGQE